MNTEQFKKYLSKRYENQRVIGDAVSRCKRVEKFEGDLDIHFEKNQGVSILNKLTYSKRDAGLFIEPKHSISIEGSKGYISKYEGTLSLYRAVNLYFEYKREIIKLIANSH
ncbi:hypothetical protein QGM71_12205 [Virgibacillus sp. C22-A2]|uniref:Uncharacterized protein n=1 Tax=Virgibacillus tibetensis TaxID=3042313 RepID=A0ABU6KHC4_9BACI|nr:hypothetical protein [Virgibacillus sp. C22-A2]